MLRVDNKTSSSKRSHDTAHECDDLTGSRILVVDDSVMIRRQMQHYLKRAGYQVYEAKSGEEAIYLVDEVHPDLVLMDVMMDGITGFEACERLRSMPEHKDLPVIFLTGLSDRKETVRGFSSGGIDYITKPFHPAEGLSRIRTHLRMCKLARFREDHIDELEKLNKAKDRLLQVTSHDLRNPLASICGLAEILQESTKSFGPQEQEYLSCIEKTARRMSNLVNDLLDLSALDSGHLELERVEFDLAGLIRQICSVYELNAAEKNIRLRIYAGEEPLSVFGDPQQLHRVIENMLGNALKFTPKGGEVTIAWIPGASDLKLQVLDSGPGIMPEDRKYLFQDFGRTRNRPTAGEPSTGLGLSICKRLLEAHGGSIEHHNRAEGGSCFTAILPREKTED